MKKLLLISCLLLSLIAKAQTTTYHPFPEGDATWNFTYYPQSWSMLPNDYEHVNYSITFSGDTLINNMTYHKLITPFASLRKGYRGAIRQDIAAKKVFIVPPTEISEILLYDFNLQVGDSVKGYIFPNDTIESIDSIAVGMSFRKRWKINNGYNVYIIEGIGSTYGLLEPSPMYCTDCPEFQLNCYSENNQTIYPDLQTNCELINSLNFIETNSSEIKVCPNSQNGSTTFLFENANILEIKLIDMFAKVIYQQPTTNQKTITIDHLQSGFYILIAKSTTNKLITKKLIISLR